MQRTRKNSSPVESMTSLGLAAAVGEGCVLRSWLPMGVVRSSGPPTPHMVRFSLLSSGSMRGRSGSSCEAAAVMGREGGVCMGVNREGGMRGRYRSSQAPPPLSVGPAAPHPGRVEVRGEALREVGLEGKGPVAERLPHRVDRLWGGRAGRGDGCAGAQQQGSAAPVAASSSGIILPPPLLSPPLLSRARS